MGGTQKHKKNTLKKIKPLKQIKTKIQTKSALTKEIKFLEWIFFLVSNGNLLNILLAMKLTDLFPYSVRHFGSFNRYPLFLVLTAWVFRENIVFSSSHRLFSTIFDYLTCSRLVHLLDRREYFSFCGCVTKRDLRCSPLDGTQLI